MRLPAWSHKFITALKRHVNDKRNAAGAPSVTSASFLPCCRGHDLMEEPADIFHAKQPLLEEKQPIPPSSLPPAMPLSQHHIIDLTSAQASRNTVDPFMDEPVHEQPYVVLPRRRRNGEIRYYLVRVLKQFGPPISPGPLDRHLSSATWTGLPDTQDIPDFNVPTIVRVEDIQLVVLVTQEMAPQQMLSCESEVRTPRHIRQSFGEGMIGARDHQPLGLPAAPRSGKPSTLTVQALEAHNREYTREQEAWLASALQDTLSGGVPTTVQLDCGAFHTPPSTMKTASSASIITNSWCQLQPDIPAQSYGATKFQDGVSRVSGGPPPVMTTSTSSIVANPWPGIPPAKVALSSLPNYEGDIEGSFVRRYRNQNISNSELGISPWSDFQLSKAVVLAPSSGITDFESGAAYAQRYPYPSLLEEL